jgi:cell division septation protein DedD
MRLILFSKPGCHLCEGLQEKLEQIDGLDFTLEVLDITTRDDWLQAYQYEVPVLFLQPEVNVALGSQSSDQTSAQSVLDPNSSDSESGLEESETEKRGLQKDSSDSLSPYPASAPSSSLPPPTPIPLPRPSPRASIHQLEKMLKKYLVQISENHAE